MQVVDIEFRPGGLTVFFDDDTEVVANFKVIDGVLYLVGLSNMQKQALAFFKANQIDDIARLDPRLAANVSTTPLPIEPFNLIHIPDTQNYSANSNTCFNTMTRWIANNAHDQNIKFVSHSGDIVNNGSITAQYDFADAAMANLDGVLPVGIAPGNHDFSPPGNRAG